MTTVLDEQDIQIAETTENTSGQGKHFEPDIYKRWHRKGFISIRPWSDAGRFVIDIGTIDPNTKAKISNDIAYVNALDLLTYLKAVRDGYGTKLYPIMSPDKVPDRPSDESFVVYGGSDTAEGPISRIFKIHHWAYKAGDNYQYDNKAFAWKIGVFKANRTSEGAFIAIRSQSLSYNMIKVDRLEMAKIANMVELTMISNAAQGIDLLSQANAVS